MAIRVGDRVMHQNSRESFGTGVIKLLGPGSGSALVQWDRRRVDRKTSKLSQSESHVNRSSLFKLGT